MGVGDIIIKLLLRVNKIKIQNEEAMPGAERGVSVRCEADS